MTKSPDKAKKPAKPLLAAVPGMQLEVRDFGPIAEGRIDLRPLTVFAGPSNTGKSWMATLIYVLGRYRLLAVREGAEKSANGALPDELRRCYGVAELSDLVRFGGEGKSSIKFSMGQAGHKLSFARQGKHSLHIDSPAKAGEAAVSDSAGQAGRVYYLPADRSGIMHAYSVMVGASAEGTPGAVLLGTTADFVEKIADVGGKIKAAGGCGDESIPRLLEDRILLGRIQVRLSRAGQPVVTYRPNDWKGREKDREVPIMAASAMVSELSPLVLLLRYFVQAGDTLIINEPEAHLHPAVQRRFIEEIVAWVHGGIKVVLTTHSEWIMEELATIVGRGEFKEKPEDLTYLEKEKVGVWLFDRAETNGQGEGSIVTEDTWSINNCGYEPGFYPSGADSHNDWIDTVEQIERIDRIGDSRVVIS